jgi:hypothetical protein
MKNLQSFDEKNSSFLSAKTLFNIAGGSGSNERTSYSSTNLSTCIRTTWTVTRTDNDDGTYCILMETCDVSI